MEPSEALARWGRAELIRTAPDAGLINRTWEVGDPPVAILQWVNPIFKPAVHLDIEAVTSRLEARGLLTPRLLRTTEGGLWVDDSQGCWRLMSYVPGRTVHRMDSPARAATSGALVGRFHAAVAGWSYTFEHCRPGAHDTPRHMATLAAAMEAGDAHPLAVPAQALGRQILDQWARWEGTLDLPERVCHGDLKVSNLRFDSAGERAICLLDLDTMASLPLAVEMGDAWRSWCNPAGEDDPDAVYFDLDLFEASATAWLAELGPLPEAELASLVPGVERICLELAARFCADALRNTYFREDRQRFPEVGAHNLWRARGQHRLAVSARARATQASAVLRRAAQI